MKSFLSGVFTFAREEEIISTNPIPSRMKVGGVIEDFKGDYFTEDEIDFLIRKLPNPARTVVATAAYTGILRSELRGLLWKNTNFSKREIKIGQKVINVDGEQHIGPTKTKVRSEEAIPIAKKLLPILVEYQTKYPPMETGFVFRSPIDGQRAMNLDNLARRVIQPLLESNEMEWKGWHAFRRGFGTMLADPKRKVSVKTAQKLLRHSDPKTTLQFYTMTDEGTKRSAVDKL